MTGESGTAKVSGAAGDAGTPSSGRSKKGTAGLLLAALIVAAVSGTGPLVRYLKAPVISEGFGLEDAVVALRLEARDISYLVLVNEEGETRSVRLEERGFENSRLAWSAEGLSTGGPRHEYVLREEGLAELAIPDQPAPSEHQRLASETGFTVLDTSTDGTRALFVGGTATGELTSVDTDYATPQLASCEGVVVMAGEDGVEEVTPETRDFDGLGMFDDVESLSCDGDRVYGLGGISDEAKPREALRVWDRSGGGAREYEVRYPEAVLGSPETAFVHDGRLYWAADSTLWSVEAPMGGSGAAAADAGDPAADAGDPQPQTLESVAAADLAGSVGTDDPFAYDAVVGTDSGVLAPASGRVYGAAADEELVERRRGGSYDRLNGMAIFSVDVRTGERRVEIEVDDIDFPERDLRVHAIAVDPEWASGR